MNALVNVSYIHNKTLKFKHLVTKIEPKNMALFKYLILNCIKQIEIAG